MVKIIKQDEFITKTWSGGTTTELYIYPENGDYAKREFGYRISTATVETETSEFTELKGINRLIMSLDYPLSLKHNNDDYIDLDAFEVNRFKGDDKTISKGKVRDFNVMFTDDYDADMFVANKVVIDKKKFVILYAFDEPSTVIVDELSYELQIGDLMVIEDSKTIVKPNDSRIVVVKIKKK